MIFGHHSSWHAYWWVAALLAIGGFIYTVVGYVLYWLMQDWWPRKSKATPDDLDLAYEFFAVAWPGTLLVLGILMTIRYMMDAAENVADLLYQMINDRRE